MRQEQFQQQNIDASYRPERVADRASKIEEEALRQQRDLEAYYRSTERNDQTAIENAGRVGEDLKALSQFVKDCCWSG